MRNIYLVVILAFFISFSALAQEKIEVKVYKDKASASWAYKTNDTAFVYDVEGCFIKYNAEEFKEGFKTLSVRRKCNKPFKDQAKIHKAILTKINKKWPLQTFKSLSWGPLCPNDEWSWCEPIIKASMTNADYIDYWQHYPNSKLKSINNLFVQLASDTKAYKELAAIFNDFNLDLKMISVEKVFEYRLKEAPFYELFKEKYPHKNPRVMFDAGMVYFKITNKVTP